MREFGSNSNGAIIAIKELHEAFEAAPESARGLVPVVKCESVVPVKSKFGTNYQPELKITKWVPRPEALPLVTEKAEVPPPVTVSTTSPTARSREPKLKRRSVSVELKESYFRQAARSLANAERIALSGSLFDRMGRPMTDPRLPGDWQEQDALGSYHEAIREIGKRVRAGEPIPDCLLPEGRK